MKKTMRSVAILAFLAITGCAVTPQNPISLNEGFWEQQEQKIGIVTTKFPNPNVYLPGADCLLCMAVAEGAHSKLSKHVDTLSLEGLPELKTKIKDVLNEKGVNASVINQELDLKKLPKFVSKLPNTSKKNFALYGKQHDVTHVLVVDLTRIGMLRNYSSYIPTSDPKAVFSGSAYIVDVSTNTYSAYKPVEVYRSGGEVWDEPPSYPSLTDAYYQALEMANEAILSVVNEQIAAQEPDKPSTSN